MVFWFWTTYLPLDRYGNRALEDLKRLEKRLRSEFYVDVRHFEDFDQERMQRGWFRFRARWAICFFLIWIHLAFMWGLVVSVVKIVHGHSLVRTASQAVTIQVPD